MDADKGRDVPCSKKEDNMKNEYRFGKVYSIEQIEKIGMGIRLRGMKLNKDSLIASTALDDYIFAPNGQNWELSGRAIKAEEVEESEG